MKTYRVKIIWPIFWNYFYFWYLKMSNHFGCISCFFFLFSPKIYEQTFIYHHIRSWYKCVNHLIEQIDQTGMLGFKRRPPDSWLKDFADSEVCSAWKEEEKSNRLVSNFLPTKIHQPTEWNSPSTFKFYCLHWIHSEHYLYFRFHLENSPFQIKLGDGIEIYEDQLRSVKWNDYRKLTRGLATILFSPAELATCSVTGQRWSRAGSVERPVKPALDRAKVQAIICKSSSIPACIQF